MLTIEPRPPTIEEYLELRRSVGWSQPTPDDARRALAHDIASAVAVEDGHAVGLGRVVGDGAFYSFVVDLIVRREAQQRGIGRALLAALEEAVSARSTTGEMQLVADPGVTGFYERCGYARAESNLLLKRLSSATGRHRVAG